MLIDTEDEPSKITELRSIDPEKFAKLRKNKAESEIWKMKTGKPRPIKSSRLPEWLMDELNKEVIQKQGVPDHIKLTYRKALGLQMERKFITSQSMISLDMLVEKYNIEIDGSLSGHIEEDLIDLTIDREGDSVDSDEEPQFTYEYMVKHGMLYPDK